MGKSRLEAFSDGVFAVAITLLAFDLAVPAHAGGHLATELGHEWPQMAAYATSFLIIGIIWINHHAVLALAARVDRPVLIANMALLLPIVTIPFATNLFATYLRAGHDGRVAAAVYSGVMAWMAVTFSVLYRFVVHEDRTHAAVLDRATVRRTTVRFGIGQVFYLALVGIAFVSPVAVLIGQFALAAFYLFDQTGARDLRAGDDDRDEAGR